VLAVILMGILFYWIWRHFSGERAYRH
jgi:hypothetical protein